jgi:carboxyl-terminal processing protease
MSRSILKLFFTVLILFATLSLEGKPPQLSPKDTRIKIEEILKAHVSHHKLTPELVTRTLHNYLEELDPAKTYFLESDLQEWLEPTPQLLEALISGYAREDFSAFAHIHRVMLKAIERRALLEQELMGAVLPKEPKELLFKDLKWAKTEEELKERLCQIKALQLQTAEKIAPENAEQFMQRIHKRRLSRESDLIGSTPKEQEQIQLAHVLKATSSALDSQTMYFTPAEASQFIISVQQRLFGIGAQLRDDLSGFSIVRIVEGGPASMNGALKVGDKIVAVDREPIVGMEISEAVQLIRGPQGTAVLLTILRDTKNPQTQQMEEERYDIEIVRGEVVLKESRLDATYEPYGDGVIAIVHLYSFYQDANSSSASDIAEALESLKNQHNVKGVVLDLRNNAGGLMDQAVAVTGLFISKGVVVSVKDNTGRVRHMRNLETQKVWDGPLVVLTNRLSASAAEIVAQALQDYGRALIIGDVETFGKGTVQSFTLESAHFDRVNPKGEYKVTRGRYYTVSGKSPQLVGVKADIVVSGSFSEMEIGEKYSKFPLEPDQISPSFEDTLADIPLLHRSHFERVYKKDLQKVQTQAYTFLEQLKKNSQERLLLSENYQNFLKELSKEEGSDPSEIFGQTDLQLRETLNIMKDLLILSHLYPNAA